MKLIHLNVESCRYFEPLVEFFEQEKPDFCSLVEAADGDYLRSGKHHDHLVRIAEKLQMNLIFAPTTFRDMEWYSVGLWAAVLSKYPVISHEIMYLGWSGQTHFPNNYPLFVLKEKYERYPYAADQSLPLLSTKIDVNGKQLEILTTHFHVTFDCIESEKMVKEEHEIAKYISHNKTWPLILTGDFNIEKNSLSIELIGSYLTNQSLNFTNTLCKTIHPIFKNKPDHPGLAVDHVFTRDILVENCEVRNVTVSDHLPVVLDFQIE